MLAEALAIFLMLAILSVLIIVHECGHFSVARFFGFQTPVFGFGLPFGPHWVVGKKWGTEFRIHACLLGGYVAIPELGDESNQEAFGLPLKPFRKFPIWQRALVAFAGVGFNILFAYLIMFMMLLFMGDPSASNTAVGKLIPNNPAIQSGVKDGDILAAVDDHKVLGPEDAVQYISVHKGTPVRMSLVRDGQPLTIDVTTTPEGKVGMVLVEQGPTVYRKLDKNIFEISILAWERLGRLTMSMFDALGQLCRGLFLGAKPAGGGQSVSIGDLHGVLAVVKIGADIAKQDWSKLFIFTIYISLDLAIINLLPWPALDGGHLAFMAFEAVRGRPMGERAQGEIVKWGFISLIVLMVVIMVNDVTALMTGKLDLKPQSKQKQQTDAK